MSHIINNTETDLGDVKEVSPLIFREPNFGELYTTFEIEYEEFLNDTSDEIAKRAQRLLELKSIVSGNSPGA